MAKKLSLFSWIFLFIFFGQQLQTQKNQFKEVKFQGQEEIFFSQPVDIETDGSKVFVLDGRECVIRVFSYDGQEITRLGRYGHGPGEFINSSDMDVSHQEIALLDSEGQRVILYSLDGGYQGEFKIGFRGYRILRLSKDRFLITRLPRFREKNVFLINIFNREGKRLAQAEKVSSSSEIAYDFFLFQHFLIKRENQPLLVKPFGPELAILLNERGERMGEIKPTAKQLEFHFVPPLPRARKIKAYFWSATSDDHKIYLILPGRLADGDLGPSNKVAVLNDQDQLESLLEFPWPIYRMAKIGQRFFVLDEAARLRLLDLTQK